VTAGEHDELRVVADQFAAPTSANSIAEAVAMILARGASAAELVKDFAAANGLVHLANSGSTSWHGFASTIVEGSKARGQPVKAAWFARSRQRIFRPKPYAPTRGVRHRSNFSERSGAPDMTFEQAVGIFREAVGNLPLDAIAVALIVLGIALVCGALISKRRRRLANRL